jgi:predicted methyltransferase
MPDRDWWQALWPDPKRVLEDIGVVGGMQVIDLCSGDGYFTAPMGQLVADGVLIANTFHGAPNHTGLARAVRATLRDEGTFVVINWWPRPREETTVLGKPRGPRPELRFSPDQVAAWVEPAGFRLREVKKVSPYHYGAIFDVAVERDR